MKSTIVIPSYNGIRYLENCLKSLKKEDAHIIVIDNGSTDGSYDMICDNFPEVEVISFFVNTGFCRAVNAGIVAAETKYVIFLNNDTVVEPGFVKELERVMEQDKRIFSASAKVISMQEKDKIDDAGDLYCALGWAYAIGKGKPERNYQESYPIFASCGAASIYRRCVFEQIGILDENHFAYLEDIDLGYRAQIYGYRNVFAPKARVYHAGSASSGSRYNQFKTDLSSINSIYLIYKNMPTLQVLLNLPFLLLGFGIKTLFFLHKGLGKAYVCGLVKGLRFCTRPEAKRRKVPYRHRHFLFYCRIQVMLWWNMVRRLL
ncbi:MAG: glycosyltransferase family 2 protein [Lachnospiraceae bacterium]|nr:glycosyltransferase family 2 protein [Lachnospiraceae bacterium]